eukprot:SAG22_NODE_465_length_10181_cov_6.604444_8_plen_122_part_00
MRKTGPFHPACLSQGTLTEGKPAVTEFELVPPPPKTAAVTVEQALAALGAAEAGSEHPLAAAIVRYAKTELDVEHFPDVADFISLPGRGIRCAVPVAAAKGGSSGSGEPQELQVRGNCPLF